MLACSLVYWCSVQLSLKSVLKKAARCGTITLTQAWAHTNGYYWTVDCSCDVAYTNKMEMKRAKQLHRLSLKRPLSFTDWGTSALKLPRRPDISKKRVLGLLGSLSVWKQWRIHQQSAERTADDINILAWLGLSLLSGSLQWRALWLSNV